MHIKIVHGNDVVVDIPDWDGPIPMVGDYIFHPPFKPGNYEGIAGCVATRTWRTHDRVGGTFVKTNNPYVELQFSS